MTRARKGFAVLILAASTLATPLSAPKGGGEFEVGPFPRRLARTGLEAIPSARPGAEHAVSAANHLTGNPITVTVQPP